MELNDPIQDGKRQEYTQSLAHEMTAEEKKLAAMLKELTQGSHGGIPLKILAQKLQRPMTEIRMMLFTLQQRGLAALKNNQEHEGDIKASITPMGRQTLCH